MDSERDRLFAVLFHAWVEVFFLFAFLFLALSAWRWAQLRADGRQGRGTIVPWGMVCLAFGLTLLLRSMDPALPQLLVIAFSVGFAGMLSVATGTRWVWPAAVLLAVLLGRGMMIGALALAIAGFLASFSRTLRS